MQSADERRVHALPPVYALGVSSRVLMAYCFPLQGRRLYGTSSTHRRAAATEAVRRAMQNGQEGLRSLVLWDQPEDTSQMEEKDLTANLPTGPKEAHSTVLSIEKEAAIVAFRKVRTFTAWRLSLCPAANHTASKASLPPPLLSTTRHILIARCGKKNPLKKRFKQYPIGFFHIDTAELRTAEGKLYLYAAIRPTSKFAFVQLLEKASRRTPSDFLRAPLKAVPHKIHTILTDDGIQFRDLPPVPMAQHCFTKVNHRWTKGQVERVNRTIKEAAVKRCRHYDDDDHNQLRSHLDDSISAYNFARRLKTLKGLTPYEFIHEVWTEDPKRVTLDPIYQMPGLKQLGCTA